MHKKFLPLLLACSLLTGCAGLSLPDPDSDKTDIKKIKISELTPGDDFYGFMNAAELMKMSLRQDQTRTGTFAQISEKTDDRITEIIEEIAAGSGYEKGSNEQLIHDLYHLAADANAEKIKTEEADTAFFDGLIGKINGTGSVEELFALWGEMAKDFGFDGVPIPVSVETDLYHADKTILSFGAYPRSISLEDINEDDMEAARTRDQFVTLLAQSGVSRSEGRKRAVQIVIAETELAAVIDFDQLEDGTPDLTFHPYETKQLRTELNNITPEQILKMNGITFKMPETVSVALPEQLTVMDGLLDDEHLPMWKDYTVCALLQQFSDMLPPKYRGEARKSGKTDSEYAADIVRQYLQVELGEEYAARYCDAQTVRDVTKISRDIIAKYEELIAANDWMSAEGKRALREKLSQMQLFIGADEPREIDPKNAEQIGDSLLSTCCAANRLGREEQLSQFGKPTDKNGFRSMVPQEVNACYVPDINAFNVTAAIMQAPFYDPNASYDANLGGIGSVIGHEISHGFDENGMAYDANGNYRPDWIPQADRDAFKALTDRVTEYYNGFRALDSHRVNGKKTLSENLADISGVQCVLAIAGTPDRQKTVLEHYAKVWEELLIDTEAKEQIDKDSHSPASVRINAVVACFDPFYEIYGVKETDALYVAPENRLRRW